MNTQDQKLELQIDERTRQGCGLIFKEKKIGRTTYQPELEKMLGQLRSGDTVVVWKLDRLGRSLRNLIDLGADFKDRGVAFINLQDGINTATPTSRFTFNLFASLAEFEREIIRERIKAGLVAAKTQERNGGRPGGISPAAMGKAKLAKLLYDSDTKTGEIASDLKATSPSTIENKASGISSKWNCFFDQPFIIKGKGKRNQML